MKKVLCVICPKTGLEQIDNFMFLCPKCHRSYNLYYEVMAYEDTLESTHQDQTNLETAGLDAAGPGLLSAADSDNEFPSLDEQYEELHNKGKIPIPKYMKNGTVTTVEEFREELE